MCLEFVVFNSIGRLTDLVLARTGFPGKLSREGLVVLPEKLPWKYGSQVLPRRMVRFVL